MRANLICTSKRLLGIRDSGKEKFPLSANRISALTETGKFFILQQ